MRSDGPHNRRPKLTGSARSLAAGRSAARRRLRGTVARGYTPGMKTAVSIPDDIFAQAERLARRAKKSRSQLFSDALREYITRHSPDEVTEAMNRAIEEVGAEMDPFVAAASKRALERVEW